MAKREKYRRSHNAIYEYSDSLNAYVFIGNLNGKTYKQFIDEYEFKQSQLSETNF